MCEINCIKIDDYLKVCEREIFKKPDFKRCMLYRRSAAIGTDWNLNFWDNSLYLRPNVFCKHYSLQMSFLRKYQNYTLKLLNNSHEYMLLFIFLWFHDLQKIRNLFTPNALGTKKKSEIIFYFTKKHYLLLIEYHEMLLHQLSVTFKKGDFLRLFMFWFLLFYVSRQNGLWVSTCYISIHRNKEIHTFFLLKL